MHSTWADLAAYVREEYEVIEEREDEIRLEFRFEKYDEEDERSQIVVLLREVLDNKHEWVQIASPVGLAASVDLAALLREVGHGSIACGAAIMGDHVVLRHSLPLRDLDVHEFDDPLALLAGTADQIEEMFFGGDGY
ncbi:hypothetical protein UO65_4677 [Actinokineospora spheciospongiae]|uniref:YbjN domain-containing protein n=1 Tax=Actinokineospora spheciospongiae TaxID=909613 RepID=W7J1P1_9PSEU|nr:MULTISPECIES: hypothetical protein [Actinokineospora]EWC60024.1 hypothetical protein UO65_4677 [Actinokineospora spheciospongiae]MCG8920411.1 YbjN domain-containing protein [Actinokineospora sp. PR83]PWW51977.1 hypothetical protein DFQ13_11972 [Actinokineospora spheciospongiae]